jgi:hypothetical protein
MPAPILEDLVKRPKRWVSTLDIHDLFSLFMLLVIMIIFILL